MSLQCPSWHALWTHSHYEQLVCDQLTAKGFNAFLPKIDVWSRRGGVKRPIRLPMFPGYLFLQHQMDKASFIEVNKIRGLVRILGGRWDCLTVVPDGEIKAVQTVVQTQIAAWPYPYLKKGQRVLITRGPLANVEGILVHTKANKGLFVLSVDLLQRSVAVEVDCSLVVST